MSEEFSDEKLCQSPVTAELAHSPKDFIKRQAEEHNRKVGMVVDLTFTHKYYDGKKEFEEGGVEYLKIMTQGGGTEPPKKADLDNFTAKVIEFFKKKPEEFCAVHCTHGINRSGFFIVTFLVEQCQLAVKDALAAFAASRAPGIWDHNFIDGACFCVASQYVCMRIVACTCAGRHACMRLGRRLPGWWHARGWWHLRCTCAVKLAGPPKTFLEGSPCVLCCACCGACCCACDNTGPVSWQN